MKVGHTGHNTTEGDNCEMSVNDKMTQVQVKHQQADTEASNGNAEVIDSLLDIGIVTADNINSKH